MRLRRPRLENLGAPEVQVLLLACGAKQAVDLGSPCCQGVASHPSVSALQIARRDGQTYPVRMQVLSPHLAGSCLLAIMPLPGQ